MAIHGLLDDSLLSNTYPPGQGTDSVANSCVTTGMPASTYRPCLIHPKIHQITSFKASQNNSIRLQPEPSTTIPQVYATIYMLLLVFLMISDTFFEWGDHSPEKCSAATCTTFQMTHIGLGRSQLQGSLPTIGQGSLKGTHFHRISQGCAGAMRFETSEAKRS